MTAPTDHRRHLTPQQCAAIHARVDAAPPLTARQRDRLRAVFRRTVAELAASAGT
ncbi:hypothetical protein [Kutzneria sp. NPDC051319]|uniref:hypothetical protein n=1 Tax=Kutzneria sp. NPDC051319 TaxID=3155047 RepID=UPI0034470528